MMTGNYIKISRRTLLKNKSYSFIKISGLALGMSVAMLLGLWIFDELSFNSYYSNSDRIAQIMRHTTVEGKKETGGQSSPFPLAVELRSSFGKDFEYVVLSTKTVNYIVGTDDKKFTQPGRFMQPDAPEMLTLNMLRGDRTGLREGNSILLSATLAEKLFGSPDAVGKVVTIDNRVDVNVTGVYEDIPRNADFNDVSYIAPFDLYGSLNAWVKKAENNWNDNSFPIYVQISPQATYAQVSGRIKDIMLPHLDAERKARHPEVFLHPMSKWHLYSKFEDGVNVMSEPLRFVWLYGFIGIFVLLLACINFMNLSTARSERAAKEVGIRKTIGSARSQLVGQFLSDSLLIATIAFAMCLGLTFLVLPWFNGVAGKDLHILWHQPLFWVSGITFTFITALLAGSYPAFYLSSLKPAQVLKGAFRSGRAASMSRKVLVIFQFTISIILMIGTIVIYQQIQFAKNRPVGYDRHSLLRFSKSNALNQKSGMLRNELLRTGVVEEVAESTGSLTEAGSNNTGFSWNGKDPALDADFGTIGVTFEYGKTIGWQFVDGRDFSSDSPGDSSGVVINEAAVKLMGLQKPVGEIIQSNYLHKGKNFKILGVIKDVVMESPFAPARPSIFFLSGGKWIFVKIRPVKSMHEALPEIETLFKKLAPSDPFEYTFVDEAYAAKFAAEERIGKLAVFFSTLAIIISCLGMFGLASFVAEQRTKEMGIRKVLGASVLTLWQLLSRDFAILVVISCFIAIPVAYHFLFNWLQHYEYRIALVWWYFAGAGLIALLITMLTVSYQMMKTAMINPVRSLRSE